VDKPTNLAGDQRTTEEILAARLGAQLRQARLRQGRPQVWVARRVGISGSTLCEWEKGSRVLPRLIVWAYVLGFELRLVERWEGVDLLA